MQGDHNKHNGNDSDQAEKPQGQSIESSAVTVLADEDDKAERATLEQLKNASLVNQSSKSSSKEQSQPLATEKLGALSDANSQIPQVSSGAASANVLDDSTVGGNNINRTVPNAASAQADGKNDSTKHPRNQPDSTPDSGMHPDQDQTLTTQISADSLQDSNLALEKRHEKSRGEASPRRKRSRDQLDGDIDREQKIAATEEARAQRLSSEGDRMESEKLSEAMTDKHPANDSEHQAKSVFGTVNTVTNAARGSEASRVFGASAQQPASSSAFASSGFAVLANSSASPFSAFAPSSSSTSAFSAHKSVFKNEPSMIVNSTSSPPEANEVTQSTLLGSPQASPFVSLKQSGTAGSVFGGTLPSQGFDNNLAAGRKLTTFAAANGDAKLGATGGAPRPLGSVKEGNDDGQHDHSDEDDEGEFGKDEPNLDEDDRFRSQDVETGEDGEETLFASRASLFSFKNNAWKESGKGIFKFNVASSSASDVTVKTGRFIMRAHQTFRVLLNAPVFKEMKVGDSKGNEPVGKSFAFAVVEGGRPTPHMVKLGDTAESKNLYSAVRNLQQHLDP